MVGRFQVMALLQAARAKVLGHPLDEAQSFGLNRAIFYAAAKRGFKGGPSAKRPGEQQFTIQAYLEVINTGVKGRGFSGLDPLRASADIKSRIGRAVCIDA